MVLFHPNIIIEIVDGVVCLVKTDHKIGEMFDLDFAQQ
jgi:hypothetical protein